jgi:uncharacterized protein
VEQKFIGRARELALLDRLWASEKSQFLVLYGRRRVGKTRLLAEWISRKTAVNPPPKVLFWVADQDNQESHLRQFSKVVFERAYPGSPVPENFSFNNWEDIWGQLAELARAERVAVIIDEFSYVMESNPAIASSLQRAWDSTLERSDIFLCLSGSHLGMMERGILSGQAPLYGRTTGILELRPLPFGMTGQFFPNYSPEERVALYSVFGGIPHYWQQIDPGQSVGWNVDTLVFSPGGVYRDEDIILLHDFVKEPQNYVAILKAIASGYGTPKEIESATGIRNVHVGQYLSNLVDTGYVIRRTPVTASGKSRFGRYAITDPFLRYYFRFVASRLSQIALGQNMQASAELRQHWVDFIGRYTWEEICREWVLRASNISGTLPLYPDRIDSAWTKDAQVDVVGVNFMKRHLILGECKWTNQRERANVLRGLAESKTAKILPPGSWQVLYLGFSKAGWNEPAGSYADEINETKPEGKAGSSEWRVVGMKLLSLADVDADLAKCS